MITLTVAAGIAWLLTGGVVLLSRRSGGHVDGQARRMRGDRALDRRAAKRPLSGSASRHRG